jgi:hypothetical protein
VQELFDLTLCSAEPHGRAIVNLNAHANYLEAFVAYVFLSCLMLKPELDLAVVERLEVNCN